MRHALIAGLALGLVACANPYVQPGGEDRRGATVKIVDAKRPPATLIALDRSICLVTANRYGEIRVGDAVYCHWRGGDSGPGMLAPARDDDRPRGVPRTAVSPSASRW